MNYCQQFKDWLAGIATRNGISYVKAETMWRKYADECRVSDQSPVTFEFLKWNNLKGEQMT